MTRLARLRRSLKELFPERLLYIHTDKTELKAIVLSPRRQAMAAAVAVLGAVWLGVGTAAVVVNAFELSRRDRELARTEAKYERWIADRQARLNSAMVQLSDSSGAMGIVASDAEKRHAALAMLLTEVRETPGAAEALAPVLAQDKPRPNVTPLRRVEMVRLSQERLLDAADSFAKSRADRLRLAFRLAGLTPSAYIPTVEALGGPLIEDGDPRALAAILDIDEDFAERVQQAASGLSEARALRAGLDKLPLGMPTEAGARSSGFGVRVDPFTRRPAFHSGLDFAGAAMTPVESTGPGVVSYAAPRAGYGNTVEVDHGGGLKTRYAHLSSIGVRVGERVAVGQRLGGMGSTGRSTGPHLHYEVWLKGRPQNPDRFVKAGEYVLKNS